MIDVDSLQKIAGRPIELGPELRWSHLKARDIVCIAPAMFNRPETVFKFAAEVINVVRCGERKGKKIHIDWMWLWSLTGSWPKLNSNDQTRFETWMYIRADAEVGYPVIRDDKVIIPVYTWRLWKFM